MHSKQRGNNKKGKETEKNKGPVAVRLQLSTKDYKAGRIKEM